MIRKRIFLLSLVTIFLIIASVSATTKQEYYDNTPFPVYGSWDSGSEEAEEAYHGGTYKLELIFQMNSIPQDGDDYKIEIDYDGCTPGGHGAETLIAQYRWGTSGSWITIDTFYYAKHQVYDINDPTSTTIQILFLDQNRWWWDSQHTWDFGFEPILQVYWND